MSALPAQHASPSHPPVVTVTEVDGSTLVEPVLGVGQYRNGRLILLTIRDPHWSILPPGPYAYMWSPSTVRVQGHWLPVWGDPSKVRAHVVANPVGTAGRVSNRTITVVDYDTVVPTHSIQVSSLDDRGERWARW